MAGEAINRILVFKADQGNTIALEADTKVLFFDKGCYKKRLSALQKTVDEYVNGMNKSVYLFESHSHSDHNNLYIHKKVVGNQSNNTELLGDIVANAVLDNSGAKHLTPSDIENEFSGVKVFAPDDKPKCFPGFWNDPLDRDKFDDNVGFDEYTKAIGDECRDKEFFIENERSYMLSVNMNGKRIILPADRSYYSWPDPVPAELDLKNVDVLIAPHHGRYVYVDPRVFSGKNQNKVHVISCSCYIYPVIDCNYPKNLKKADITKANDKCIQLYRHKSFLENKNHIAKAGDIDYKSTAELKDYSHAYEIKCVNNANGKSRIKVTEISI